MYKKYILKNKEFFARIPRSAVDVIDVCTNIKDVREVLVYRLNPETGEEKADMCQALVQIKNDAQKQGIKQGIKQGLEQGTERINTLIQVLLADGRQEDLLRSATDALFQQKLFREYGI